MEEEKNIFVDPTSPMIVMVVLKESGNTAVRILFGERAKIMNSVLNI